MQQIKQSPTNRAPSCLGHSNYAINISRPSRAIQPSANLNGDGMTSAVIFDLDGVLIDSSKVMQEAFEYAWAQFFSDKEAPFTEFKTHMGQGLITILDTMNLPRAMAMPFRTRSIELADQIEIFPGVIDLLESLLDTGAYLGVSTGKETDRTHYILQHLGLDGYFKRVVCSDQVVHGKPHPESVMLHLAASGVPTAKTLFVGDAPADIECAQRAGVSSVAVLWGMGAESVLRAMKPTYTARNLDDLHSLLLCAVRDGYWPQHSA